MRSMVGAILAIAVSGCATAPQHPVMRPLTPAHIEAMGPTRIVVSENNNGVEKAWFYTSTQSAGAAYGLVGVLVSATMDAIINAGPSRRAQKAANEVAELLPVDALNASLIEQLRLQTPAAQAAAAAETASDVAANEAASTDDETPTEARLIEAAATAAAPTGVSYDSVEGVQRLTVQDALDDAVELSVRYTLSEDSSTLRVIAVASYQSAATPYTTPYQFEGSIPRAEREGPAYRNTFTYYSSQLEVPTLTPELRERLVASIQDSARDENGNLPAEGTNEHQSMQREIENANDDRLSKDEIAIFLTREWLRDDGARLRQEIEQAHAFIARYLLLDLNRSIAPSLAGQDELVESMTDDRTVRRIGAGVTAGSYVSSAGNVTSFSTYGNTINIARVHSERIDDIRSAARRASR
jgi:hypothetical protein